MISNNDGDDGLSSSEKEMSENGGKPNKISPLLKYTLNDREERITRLKSKFEKNKEMGMIEIIF